MDLKKQLGVFALVFLVNAVIVSADITVQLGCICGQFKGIVPVVALLMFIVAGAIYAAGQIMGAETRARANVWSTAMLVGGIIGLILAASAEYFVKMFGQFTLGTGAGSLDGSLDSLVCNTAGCVT
ncbi:hypothetical protein HY992_04540 [Candidatus Micrarchaeota archaeon]|nr:hypothetical protein [Candidatus Micrarchaeota archaeon]